MAIVSPSHQHILGGILSDVFNIVGAAVTRDIKTVGLEKIVGQLSPFSAPLDVFENPGNPLSRRFDETEAQPGKCFRQLAGNHRMARAGGICRHTPEPGAVTDALAGHVTECRGGGCGMQAPRYVRVWPRLVEEG